MEIFPALKADYLFWPQLGDKQISKQYQMRKLSTDLHSPGLHVQSWQVHKLLPHPAISLIVIWVVCISCQLVNSNNRGRILTWSIFTSKGFGCDTSRDHRFLSLPIYPYLLTL